MSQETTLLAPPPRPVSTGAIVEQIFGSTLHQMCWITLLVTSIVYWLYAATTLGRETMDIAGTDVSIRWTLLLPAFGLFMAAVAVIDGLKNIRLLRDGHTAQAKLTGKEATIYQVNKRRVYRLTFEFRDAGGQQRRVVVSSHEPEEAEDQDEETVLYDPAAPERAAVLDALPGKVGMDPMGGIEARSTVSVLMAVTVPIFTLVLNAAAAWSFSHGELSFLR